MPIASNSTVSIFADDQYSAFLNGEPIAENANSWWQAEADQIALQLSPGDYVLAVKVVDGHIRGGLAAAITRGTSSLLTTGGWRASSEEQPEWNTLSFDDSSWVYAQDMGYGWAEEYHGKSIDISANGNQAKWIWHPDFDHQQATIFFRKTFTVDNQGLIVPPTNIAPMARIQPRVFAPGLVINIGDNLDSLVEVNDPDQDFISTYTFTTTSQADGDGYFQRINDESRERITASEFSIASADLSQLEWVAGQPGTSNGIGLRATDSRGSSSSPFEAVPWSTANSRLAIVVDNSYKAWLNGALLNENPSSFANPTDFFDLNLQPGSHVLAIEGIDAGGPAAVIAALTRGSSSLITSRSWKISTEEAEGWQGIDFNDSSWEYAREYDSGTWDIALNRDNFLVPTAKWIWNDNLYDTEKAYLRIKFEIDANGQIVQPPAPPNKAPIVSVQPWNFNPDEIVNIGSAFETLFSVSDPDGDPIVEYEFFDSNLSDVSGNFYRSSTNERYTTNQFTIKAEDLHDLEWRSGITNSIDGIRLKATDQYGATNEWQAENSIWRSRRRLSINSPVVNEGETIPFTLSRFDQIDQPLGLWLQVNSGLEMVEIENDEIRDRLNRGERILLPFEDGASSLDFDYFAVRQNNIPENDTYPALDISIFADMNGGEPLIGSLAKATDVTPVISVGTADFPRNVTRGEKLFFILERKSNTQEATRVSYSISGNAIEGVDYKRTSGSVVFEPKEFIKLIEVETLTSPQTGSDKTIQLSLQPGADYAIDNSNNLDSVILKQPQPPSLGDIKYAGADHEGKPFVKALGNFRWGKKDVQLTNLPSSIENTVSFYLGEGKFKQDGILDNGKPTYIYCPGWQDSPQSPNSQFLWKTMQSKLGSSANLAIVDWSGMAAKTGSNPQPIFEASVTRQVGKAVADALIKAGASIENTTLIGHSLGSFVLGSTGKALSSKYKSKPKEFVALDTAFGVNYDTDASNGWDPGKSTEIPYFFTSQLANTTSSYTVSDLSGLLGSAAGDNKRAATAMNPYLVQFSPTEEWKANPFKDPAFTTAYHNATISTYADLFSKDLLHPDSAFKLPTKKAFNERGEVVSNGGNFKGVVIAPQPWISDVEKRKAVRAIGWLDPDSPNAMPVIYGSQQNDWMFFDGFNHWLLDGLGGAVDTNKGVTLNGGGGNDNLGAYQRDGRGIDTLIGGAGADTFHIGFQRYGRTIQPYKDKWDIDFLGKGFSHVVIKDFKTSEQDKIIFGWPTKKGTPKQELGYGPASDHGLSGGGTVFHIGGDLITHVPTLNPSLKKTKAIIDDPSFFSFVTRPANFDQNLLA
jgi:hypothetical protein